MGRKYPANTIPGITSELAHLYFRGELTKVGGDGKQPGANLSWDKTSTVQTGFGAKRHGFCEGDGMCNVTVISIDRVCLFYQHPAFPDLANTSTLHLVGLNLMPPNFRCVVPALDNRRSGAEKKKDH